MLQIGLYTNSILLNPLGLQAALQVAAGDSSSVPNGEMDGMGEMLTHLSGELVQRQLLSPSLSSSMSVVRHRLLENNRVTLGELSRLAEELGRLPEDRYIGAADSAMFQLQGLRVSGDAGDLEKGRAIFRDLRRQLVMKKEGYGPLARHIYSPIPVRFYKLGGTWDMIERGGKRVGSGNLDDDALKKMQQAAGLFDAKSRETRICANRALALAIYERFQATHPLETSVEEHFSSWCCDPKSGAEFGDFAFGHFIPLFSGDSSHLKIPIVASMISAILSCAIADPAKPMLGGQGTDTADIAVLALYDAFVFDTQLPPLLLTGANHPHSQPGSDAPGNFLDLAKVSHIALESGGYWVFHGNLYRAADLVKIDPEATRRIEGQSTFYAPHQNVDSIRTLLEYGQPANRGTWRKPPNDHPTHQVHFERLYDAFEGVYTFDLGNQNAGWMEMERIFDPSIKAVVVASHSLGNTDNETREDLIEAAKMGKLVIDVSRTLAGTTSQSYESSLLGANTNQEELGGTDKQIIAANKLNKTLARALAVRAILEGLNQQQTQILFDNYSASRRMI